MEIVMDSFLQEQSVRRSEFLSKIDLRSLMPEQLETLIAEMGQPKFRAKQLFSWLQNGVATFDEMTNISKDLIKRLDDNFVIFFIF